MSSWVEHGLPVERVEQLTVHELQRRLAERPDAQVLDVRLDGEWQGGHIDRATHLMLGDLPKGLDALGLDRERPIAAVCGSGYRSSIATSLLQRHGFKEVWNTLGGMTAWKEASLPTVDGAQPSDGHQNPPIRDEGQHQVRRPVATR
jgi:hydroxyacylglutathione hydrolase